MTGVMGKFLVTGIVLSSIVACSGSSDGGKSLKDQKVPSYNTKSCAYGLTEGSLADTYVLGTSNNTKSYFGKEFNQNYLNAVSDASVDATISFVNQTGATVYKSSLIDTKECTASLFAGANSMPTDVQKRWDEANKTTEGTDSFILGLYLPRTASYSYPSLNTGAAIIVRENTNRWTLVHEFMHHLFMLRSTEQGYDQEIDGAKFSQAASDLQAVLDRKDLSDSELALKAVEPLARFAEGLDSRLVHFTLEEMTIEATLKDSYESGKLHYVPTGSNWYIYSSAETALKNYKIVDDLAFAIRLSLPYDKTAERATLVNISNKINERKAAIYEIKRKYPFDDSALTGGVLLAGAAEQHEGCSHQAEGQEILKITSKLRLPKVLKH